MRNISFALTQEQILNRTKTETRRLDLKGHYLSMPAGTQLRGVNKCMGFKKGEKPIQLAIIELVNVFQLPLSFVTDEDVKREGFPNMTRDDFIAMFCSHMKSAPTDYVTVLRFKYVD